MEGFAKSASYLLDATFPCVDRPRRGVLRLGDWVGSPVVASTT